MSGICSNGAVSSFDHRLGEARYEVYVPQDVLPALDAAEAAALARLDLVAGSEEPLVAFSDATAEYDFIVTVAGDLAAVHRGPEPGGALVRGPRHLLPDAAKHRRCE